MSETSRLFRAVELFGPDIMAEIFGRAHNGFADGVRLLGGGLERGGESRDSEHAAAVGNRFAGRVPDGARVNYCGLGRKRGGKNDAIALRILLGVTAGGDHDAKRVFWRDLEFHAAEFSLRGR